MDLIYNILLVVQIFVSLSIIGLVLMQHGKGADAGAAFSGGASSSLFGSKGSGSFLTQATTTLAFVFFANSIGLAWIVSNNTGANTDTSGSVMESSAQDANDSGTGTAVKETAAEQAEIPDEAGDAKKAEDSEIPQQQ